ncbi:uncharacterized protein LOC143677115 isoform X1 [Tamandua tetradactyla]|uniref:uncharacterized protein LOC143677115 isoform X1 n=1 Tax=Tamandua tetradactyla TaxID=48850 RepID=UPI004053C79B
MVQEMRKESQFYSCVSPRCPSRCERTTAPSSPCICFYEVQPNISGFVYRESYGSSRLAQQPAAAAPTRQCFPAKRQERGKRNQSSVEEREAEKARKNERDRPNLAPPMGSVAAQRQFYQEIQPCSTSDPRFPKRILWLLRCPQGKRMTLWILHEITRPKQ